MDRRTFLKIAGLGSISVASGCSPESDKNLFSMVKAQDDRVTGKATWYASTCRECPAGCGILAKNREGRAIKLEGNPLHPINQGGLCARGQAALQGVYNPDRIKQPLMKSADGFRSTSFSKAQDILKNKLETTAKKGKNRVHALTEIVGENLMDLFSDLLVKFNSEAPVVFEPFAYENLKKANELAFGKPGLASYRMDKADFLISFGANFLETWLSPVEYSRKFKEMHALSGEGKNSFFYISPHQSLTGANADLWISCVPGGEAYIALGLLREQLNTEKAKLLPGKMLQKIRELAAPFTKEIVIQHSGISAEMFERLNKTLLNSRKPLILGGGITASGLNDLQTNIASNLLNFVLDPTLHLIDFNETHSVERTAKRSDILAFFQGLELKSKNILLLNNINPVYALPPSSKIKEIISQESLYVVSFSNFMDETSELSDLIIPVKHSLESWDEYSGKHGIISTVQPVMGSMTEAPHLGDLLFATFQEPEKEGNHYRNDLFSSLIEKGRSDNEKDLIHLIQNGGEFKPPVDSEFSLEAFRYNDLKEIFSTLDKGGNPGHLLIGVPSIMSFDGRGANKPWLNEIPEPLTKVAWETPLLINGEEFGTKGWNRGDLVRIKTDHGEMEAPVYPTDGILPGVLAMGLGQGHTSYGRYANKTGLNPVEILPHNTDPISGSPFYATKILSMEKTGSSIRFAHTDGSRKQHDRKIALSTFLHEIKNEKSSNDVHKKHGLSMNDFPLTPPIPEGYNRERDIYAAHVHEDYRWAMVVDLDRCIGCGACSAACYAENNIGVVGREQMIKGREMSWIRIERYQDQNDPRKTIFLPMLCQHCDNAPCEPVCPVYAPHHSKEGLNNQIYNRCIGTRFCSQNCPYKVRRFNWFEWEWPKPLDIQLNPNMTVRSKGVMEKCSFCIQRIKEAHGKAKDKNRKIQDGEVTPACMQTCPTKVFSFGNLMDKKSRVRKLIEDQRAYQIMGYLNTKPAVIYLKKVIQKI